MAAVASRKRSASSGRTIRVSAETYEQLAERARREDVTIGEIVARFLREEQRRAFFAEYDRQMRALREDEKAWADYQAELALWDSTIGDGLDEEPW